MARKKDQEEGKAGAPAWMVTYGDLVTLLLTFFVLLLSFSTMEVSKFKEAMSSLKGAMSMLPKQSSMIERVQTPKPKLSMGSDYNAKNRYKYKLEALAELIEKENLSDIISIEELGTQALIRIGDSALFDLGRAELKPGIFPVLDEIAGILQNDENGVRVEGHTDNMPIHNEIYPSNWELSMARAVNVLKYIRKAGNIDPERLSAVGNGEYHPVVPNTSPENMAKNRRVEIHLGIKDMGVPARKKDVGRFSKKR